MKNRLTSNTPKFFRVLRTIGISLAAVGTALVAAPVAIPAAVVTLGGYLILGGTIAAAVSQATKEEE